jgi:ABC-2 type transport system ATP-binding protein
MNAIVIDSVRKRFRHRPPLWPWPKREQPGDILALADVSLRATRGTVTALLGPNGSGKTTLLKLISTMLLPDSGSIFVEGFNSRVQEQEVRKRLGFAVANERSFYPRLTAQENLEFFAALDDVPRRQRRPRVLDLLKTVGLLKYADKLVMNFSSGMYPRLGIARALLKLPSVVLMDEPSRSLDPGSAVHLWELIRELAGQGATVLLASHNFQETFAVADRVAILWQGRLCGECPLVEIGSAGRLREFYFHSVGNNHDCKDPFEADAMAHALAG